MILLFISTIAGSAGNEVENQVDSASAQQQDCHGGVSPIQELDEGGWQHYMEVQDLSLDEIERLCKALLHVPLHRYRFLYDTAGDNKQR